RAVDERGHHVAVAVAGVSELPTQASELGLGDDFHLALEIAHRGGHGEAAQPTLEAGQLLFDDRLHPLGFGLAHRQVLVDDGMQIVDVVETYVIQLADLRLDVAGTAMSMTTRGRWRCWRIAWRTTSRRSTAWGAPVLEITMSARPRASGRSSKAKASPPNGSAMAWARSSVRLQTRRRESIPASIRRRAVCS